MKTNIMKYINKGKFMLMKHSPEILVTAGVIGSVVGAVMACRATTKVHEVIEDHKEAVEMIHDQFEETAGSKEEKRALTAAYFRTGVDFAKLYAPSISVGALSITSILAGNNILRKRNVALAAAYAAVDNSFKDYRGRVIKRFGEEVDHELRHGLRQEKVEEIVVDENGKEKKVKKTVTVADEPGQSDYARIFAKGEAKAWEPNYDYNLMFLKAQQNYANDLLHAHKYLFLNEVYDMLGIERSVAGQVVGWMIDDACDAGDNYVDFGMREIVRKKSDQPGDYEHVILLDFNVDGPILDRASGKGMMDR